MRRATDTPPVPVRRGPAGGQGHCWPARRRGSRGDRPPGRNNGHLRYSSAGSRATRCAVTASLPKRIPRRSAARRYPSRPSPARTADQRRGPRRVELRSSSPARLVPAVLAHEGAGNCYLPAIPTWQISNTALGRRRGSCWPATATGWEKGEGEPRLALCVISRLLDLALIDSVGTCSRRRPVCRRGRTGISILAPCAPVRNP